MQRGDDEAVDGLVVSIVVALDLASCGEGRAGGAAIFELCVGVAVAVRK